MAYSFDLSSCVYGIFHLPRYISLTHTHPDSKSLFSNHKTFNIGFIFWMTSSIQLSFQIGGAYWLLFGQLNRYEIKTSIEWRPQIPVWIWSWDAVLPSCLQIKTQLPITTKCQDWGKGQWGQRLRQNEKEIPDNSLTTVKLLLETEVILQMWQYYQVDKKQYCVAQDITLQSSTCFDVIELEGTHPFPRPAYL